MNQGDLVKLVHTTVLAWGNPDDENSLFPEVTTVTRFDGGKVVVLLELRSYDVFNYRVAWVLVDGRLGWVWEYELGQVLAHRPA